MAVDDLSQQIEVRKDLGLADDSSFRKYLSGSPMFREIP